MARYHDHGLLLRYAAEVDEIATPVHRHAREAHHQDAAVLLYRARHHLDGQREETTAILDLRHLEEQGDETAIHAHLLNGERQDETATHAHLHRRQGAETLRLLPRLGLHLHEGDYLQMDEGGETLHLLHLLVRHHQDGPMALLLSSHRLHERKKIWMAFIQVVETWLVVDPDLPLAISCKGYGPIRWLQSYSLHGCLAWTNHSQTTRPRDERTTPGPKPRHGRASL